MEAVKTIIKRPLIHHVIIWGYIVAPVANILLVSAFLQVPPVIVIERMFQGYGILGSLWLLTAPFVGIALYFIHRAVWYFFLAHSALVLADFLIKWVARPLVFLEGIPPLNHLLIVLGNLALVALIAYIIQRDFRSPYFQVLQRSFREHKRVPIRHRITLNGIQSQIDDLSITGCFVSGPVHGPSGQVVLRVGEHVEISFKSETLTLAARGEVMRETPAGWGLRFLSLSRKERKDVACMLRNRYALRYKVDLPAQWRLDRVVHAARVFDISATGCFLVTEAPPLDPGTKAEVSVDVAGTDVAAKGHVVWVNRATGEHAKPQGFGFRFAGRQRRLIQLVRVHLGKLERTR